jgi:hypothetical protein
LLQPATTVYLHTAALACVQPAAATGLQPA